MHCVRRANRPSKSRVMKEALPHAIPHRIVPSPPFFHFAPHHAHAPFLESMECHHIRRGLLRNKQLAAPTPRKTPPGLQAPHFKLPLIFPHVRPQPLRYNAPRSPPP